MRKILAAATFALVLGVAGASNPDDPAPEGRAYLGFSFGGEKMTPRDFHYGLRLDHDSRFVEGAVAPLMQFDFTRQGLNAARINGMSVIKQEYRLRQAEEPAAEEPSEQPSEAPAEGAEGAEGAPAEEGFFAKTWHGITGFFGGGDEEEAGEETAAAEPAEGAAAPAGDEVTEGSFLNYNVVDWGLLAVGAVGLGFAVSEVSNSDDSEDPTTPPPPPPPPPVTVPPPITPPVSGYMSLTPQVSEEMRERLEWLDGGTGHMGDLQPQEE
jgi:hypothetical protein